jgi:hypothetical protein
MSNPFGNAYEQQVRLLLEVLPIRSRYPQFALKGGTAINLFVRNFPRLSVDIDLAYLPIASRSDSVADINSALSQTTAFAALDRQHPCDLFDIHFLLQNEGITTGIRQAFLVYLMSHNSFPNRKPLMRMFFAAGLAFGCIGLVSCGLALQTNTSPGTAEV